MESNFDDFQYQIKGASVKQIQRELDGLWKLLPTDPVLRRAFADNGVDPEDLPLTRTLVVDLPEDGIRQEKRSDDPSLEIVFRVVSWLGDKLVSIAIMQTVERYLRRKFGEGSIVKRPAQKRPAKKRPSQKKSRVQPE